MRSSQRKKRIKSRYSRMPLVDSGLHYRGVQTSSLAGLLSGNYGKFNGIRDIRSGDFCTFRDLMAQRDSESHIAILGG